MVEMNLQVLSALSAETSWVSSSENYVEWNWNYFSYWASLPNNIANLIPPRPSPPHLEDRHEYADLTSVEAALGDPTQDWDRVDGTDADFILMDEDEQVISLQEIELNSNEIRVWNKVYLAWKYGYTLKGMRGQTHWNT